MKKLALPLLSLTALLTACPDPTPPVVNYDLTLQLDGLASAPVKVTNVSTGAVLLNESVTGTKTLSGIAANSVLKIEGQPANGYDTPAAQTVTLDSSKTVTVAYKATPTYTLTVAVSGVTSAPVKVTEVATGTVLFEGPLAGSKAIAGLKANTLVKIEGQAVAGYTTPTAQTVNVTGNQSVTLAYAPAAVTSVGGKVRMSLGRPPYQGPDDFAKGKTVHFFYKNGTTLQDLPTTVDNNLNWSMMLPGAAQIAGALKPISTYVGQGLPSNCTGTFNLSDPNAQITDLNDPDFFEIDARGVTISNRINLRLQTSESDTTPLQLIYADRPVKLSVDARCAVNEATFVVKVNLDFVAGWNLMKDSGDQYAGTQIQDSVRLNSADLRLVPSGMAARTSMN
ncbi:hypothetical protein [Deinococcus arcticus]|uniref:Uncharacterized protein n=1 Tax=Deinococcus arcticus TaxID=2136176 RepID=A0A2T3W6L0_9DEIO|nr:hypothetical protein [Deinococcus arcticus]PTA67383.1 hypothetical protein C8263_12465 [Deinococcus arcticus]